MFALHQLLQEAKTVKNVKQTKTNQPTPTIPNQTWRMCQLPRNGWNGQCTAQLFSWCRTGKMPLQNRGNLKNLKA